MSIEVLVPNLPESVSDATIINWHKKPGDFTNKNENLVDLETDKVVLEIPAPEAGILTKILKGDGSTVVSSDLLAILEPGDKTPAQNEPLKNETETNKQNTPLSPAVRRLIMENQLNPDEITGTGKHERITKNDVLNIISKKTNPETPVAAHLAETPVKSLAAKELAEPERVLTTKDSVRPEQRIPMTRLRAKIAERLLQAQQNAAMLTTFNEVNMQSVIDLRNQYKARFEQKHEVKLGFMSFFVKASIEALKRYPLVNASIDNNDIIYHGYYDIGIAVSTPRGLIVPVLRDADQLDFAGIEQNIKDFGHKARENSLTYEDLNGGTFTITNGGIFGSMLSTPLLNPPQSAILGMHAIKERPVIEKGEIVIRPIMYLALSYDHRLVDGRDAVQFLATVKDCLESPAHLLLNI